MLGLGAKDKALDTFRSPRLEAKSAVFEPEIESDHLSDYFDEEPSVNEHLEAGHEPENHNLHRHHIYRIEFKFSVFLRYFFIQLLYNVVGPFIIIFSPVFGYKNLKNMRFFDLSPFSKIQAVQYFGYTTFWILWILLPNEGIYEVEIYMIASALLFRNIMVALKYSFANENFLWKMKNEHLTLKQSFDEQTIPSWKDQEDDIIHKELQTAILSLDIESSLFFFEFLGKPANPESLQHLKKKYTYNDFTTFKGIIEEAKSISGLPKILLSSQNRKPQKREITSCSKIVLDDFKAFLSQKKFDSKKLGGYNLTLDIIKYGNKKRLPKIPIAIIFSLGRALLPIIYRKLSGDNLENPGLEYAILPMQTMLFMTNYLTILVTVGDLERNMHALSQLGNLISPRKVTTERKIYPTMNIFDPITLHTWENIRKIIDRYGQRFILRNSLILAIMAAFYGVVFLIILVSVLGLNSARKYDDVTLILLGYETAAYFILLFRLLIGGAFVNDQFRVHKGILTDIRRVMTNLRRFERHILGKYPIKLDNKIYIEGLKVLKQELGEEDFESKLKPRLDQLCETIDDMLKNLKYEETYCPYTVLGIPINYGIVKSIIAGLVSLGFAIYQTQQ